MHLHKITIATQTKRLCYKKNRFFRFYEICNACCFFSVYSMSNNFLVKKFFKLTFEAQYAVILKCFLISA